ESADYLKGTDRFPKINDARIKDLSERKQQNRVSEQDLRQLDELLMRKRMEKEVVPLAKKLVDSEGHVVQLPPAKTGAAQKEQIKNGRQLFSERGCLACHMHTGTTTDDETKLPRVESHQEFGPDLSRIAAKIAPEISPNDADAKRRWVVQWILNPNIHHPRTRMPILHLTLEQADDVGAWLLSQEVKDWTQGDVPEPSSEALAALAKVYLIKAPGMTRQDAEDILSGEPNNRHGIIDVGGLPLDSDERELEAPLTNDKLKWYIGRKAIAREGCYACHEIPGFGDAKPIGTTLNDWGKKDPE